MWAAGASLGLGSAPNLRDVGGYPTRDGAKVRTGLAYRSGDLDHLTDVDAERVAGLGLHTIYDLRTDAERAALPDRIPAGSPTLIVADVFGEDVDTVAAKLPDLLSERGPTDGLGDLAALLRASYRRMVTLPSACAAFGALFTGLGEVERRPTLFHCTAGKDRTGWAAAVLLMLLDVPNELVVEDYLRSNAYVLPLYKLPLERFRAAGGDPAVLLPVLRVQGDYLDAAMAEMTAHHGTVTRYLADGLGIDASVQERIRATFRV